MQLGAHKGKPLRWESRYGAKRELRVGIQVPHSCLVDLPLRRHRNKCVRAHFTTAREQTAGQRTPERRHAAVELF